jgi:hypothetical protein
MLIWDWDANGLRRGPWQVHVTAQVLKSAQEAAGERAWREFSKMVSKLPHRSNVTSQQIGQIAVSMILAE